MMDMKNEKEKLYRTKGNLKAASGWTERLIKEILGEPDYIHECPAYICEGGVWRVEIHKRSQRFETSRVEAAEKTAAFKKGRKKLASEILAGNKSSVGGTD